MEYRVEWIDPFSVDPERRLNEIAVGDWVLFHLEAVGEGEFREYLTIWQRERQKATSGASREAAAGKSEE